MPNLWPLRQDCPESPRIVGETLRLELREAGLGYEYAESVS
jgi:hypothetical protein